MSCCVYKHMDTDGEALYIGISGDALLRTLNHEKASTWFPMVRTIEVLHFPSREVALQQEEVLVKSLKPRFNINYLLDSNMDNRERRRVLVGERSAKIRPAVLSLMGAIGEGEAARKIGVAAGTLIRFAYADVVPFVKTLEKIEDFFAKNRLGIEHAA